MPRISMWRDGAHSADFKFFDRNIKEQFTVGGTGISVHKYLGILDQGPAMISANRRQHRMIL